jgi:hypothetical protein
MRDRAISRTYGNGPTTVLDHFRVKFRFLAHPNNTRLRQIRSPLPFATPDKSRAGGLSGATDGRRSTVGGRGRPAPQTGSDETISLRPRSQPETNPAIKWRHQTRGFGHAAIYSQRLLSPSLQAIPDCHAAAPLGLTPMTTPLTAAIYAFGGFMLFALMIGFFGAPV